MQYYFTARKIGYPGLNINGQSHFNSDGEKTRQETVETRQAPLIWFKISRPKYWEVNFAPGALRFL